LNGGREREGEDLKNEGKATLSGLESEKKGESIKPGGVWATGPAKVGEVFPVIYSGGGKKLSFKKESLEQHSL